MTNDSLIAWINKKHSKGNTAFADGYNLALYEFEEYIRQHTGASIDTLAASRCVHSNADKAACPKESVDDFGLQGEISGNTSLELFWSQARIGMSYEHCLEAYYAGLPAPKPVSVKDCVKPAYQAWLKDDGDFAAIAKAVLDAAGVPHAG